MILRPDPKFVPRSCGGLLKRFGRIAGTVHREEVLGVIFSELCIGK